MKKITIIILIAMFAKIDSFAKKGELNNDSLKINIDKRTKTIIAENDIVQGYSLLGDLRALFKSKNLTLNDSTWQSIRDIVNNESNKDSVLKIVQDGKQIQIVFKKNSDNLSNTNNSNSRTVESNWPDNPKNSNNKESIKIGWDGIHVVDGNDQVHISRRGVQVIDGGNEEVSIGFGNNDDSTSNNNWINRTSFGSLSGFNVFLGLNALTGSGGSKYNPDSYTLKPFGSRYFSMGWMKSANISNGANAKFKLGIGLNFSWYNFMLDNNNVWIKGANEVELLPSSKNLKKSKLTVSYIDVPFVPYLAFKKGKFIDYIGFGGYVGYRLGSHTKTKTSDGGKKDHEYNNFYLNDFRYGLTFQLGMHNFPDLFVNYDLNPLFKSSKGPDLQGLSFGIRF